MNAAGSPEKRAETVASTTVDPTGARVGGAGVGGAGVGATVGGSVGSVASLQVYPSPVYPELQAHEKDPAVLVHAAFALQLCVSWEHSFVSVQEVKAPVEVYPVLHLQLKEPTVFRHCVLR